MKKYIEILTIIGARPQFIKSAVFSNFVKNDDLIKETIVHTGQHYDNNMSAIFYEDLKLPKPTYILNAGGLNHGAMTGRLIEQIEVICIKIRPDLILVYGDTNSTLAGALVGAKLHIPIAHIEAGLRSYNMNMPEEINRILTDRVSSLLFCPTSIAVDNLNAEGFSKFNCKIFNSGDVMFDMIKLAEDILSVKNNKTQEYALVTIHRAENTDHLDRLSGIISAINKISEKTKIVLPLHPRTRKFILENKLKFSDAVEVIEPVGYFEMMNLLMNCNYVMSDSGGLQKEAYFARKNCLILRDETEWIELVNNNNNIIVGSDFHAIVNATESLDDLNKDFSTDFYGKGDSVKKIRNEIVNFFRDIA
jgi:UDP-GlcNAc3NAcA epimerase